MKEYFTVKEGHVSYDDINKMNPKLILVLGHFLTFCEGNSLPCVITNITQRFKQSKSSTHTDGRAIDISIKGWKKSDIDNCHNYMDDIAGHLGAISARDFKKRVFVHHNVGLGAHIHLQVFR